MGSFDDDLTSDDGDLEVLRGIGGDIDGDTETVISGVEGARSAGSEMVVVGTHQEGRRRLK